MSARAVAVVIVDVLLDGADGIALLQQALDVDNRLMGIVMTGHGNIVNFRRSRDEVRLGRFFSRNRSRRTRNRPYPGSLELYRLRQKNTVLTRTLIRSGNINCARYRWPISAVRIGRLASTITANLSGVWRRGKADYRASGCGNNNNNINAKALVASLAAKFEEVLA